MENFLDRRPLIPSTGLLLHKIALDRFLQPHVSWKVRTQVDRECFTHLNKHYTHLKSVTVFKNMELLLA